MKHIISAAVILLSSFSAFTSNECITGPNYRLLYGLLNDRKYDIHVGLEWGADWACAWKIAKGELRAKIEAREDLDDEVRAQIRSFKIDEGGAMAVASRARRNANIYMYRMYWRLFKRISFSIACHVGRVGCSKA